MSSPTAASPPRGRRPWLPWRRYPRTAVAAEILLVALLGSWLGILVGGNVNVPVGPVQTRMSFTPALTGDAVLAVPPLGRLTLDSHDGPLRLDAQVTRVNMADARRIFADPATLQGLPERAASDVRHGLVRLAVRSAASAVIGALLLGALVFRRRLRQALVAAGVGAGLVLGSGGMAAATWNPDAIDEPRYDGLLAIAPSVVGDARSIVTDFEKYEKQLAKLVTNVSRLYDVTSTLPAFTPDPSTIRVLHVADLHINPAAWEVMRSIAVQFEVDMIVDSGDIADHGTSAENRYLDPIPTMGVPYVWVRGNHDSIITERGVGAQPNAVVLDGQVVEVGGLRFLGAPDPRFTPDKETRDKEPPQSLEQVGEQLADTVRLRPEESPVDVVVVHDATMGTPLDGLVPLVLAGHEHKRDVALLDGGTRMFKQGSTGAGSLRGLEGEEPTPLQCSVLYFDGETHTLQAWDDITLGGLGLASAQIQRNIAATPAEDDAPTARQTGTATAAPTGDPSQSPVPGALPPLVVPPASKLW